VEQLTQLTAHDVLHLPLMGQICLEHIRKELARRGLTLKGESVVDDRISDDLTRLLNEE
jgi:hypothetical protein